MASENSDSEDRVEASHEPRECMACRGTGRVISNLGGTASSVTCPWCEGRGVRIPDIDAQARWLEERAQADPPGDAPDSAA
jgi:DnaJ-class molecular chaperone